MPSRGAAGGRAREDEELIRWDKAVFSSLVDEYLDVEEKGAVVVRDFVSPPGTGKTYSMLLYAVRNRKNMVASFPNHENQRTALRYILAYLGERGYKEPSMYVLDYAGVERYCLLRNPELMRRLLDRYKSRPTDTYADAAQNMLGSSEFLRLLTRKGLFELVDTIMMRLAKYLDSGDERGYREYVNRLIERRGNNDICRSVCPIGLLAQKYSDNIRRALSKPKIITWRTDIGGDLPHPKMMKHVVIANPERAINYVGLQQGGGPPPDPTVFLCPRLLLIMKLVSTAKKTPTYLAARRAIILAPHSALDFVLSSVEKALEYSEAKRSYILFIDEYDSLFYRPKAWPVVPLDAARAELSLAKEVLDAGVGGRVDDVEVDEYLYAYARYVHDTLAEVIRAVEEGLRERSHDPVMDVFVEGALSYTVDAAVSPGNKVDVYPLGFRVVSVRHMLARRDLYRRILNPYLYLQDVAGREGWRASVREAAAAFRSLLSRRKVMGLAPFVAPDPAAGRAVAVRRAEARPVDVLALLRDYLGHLLEIPAFAVRYSAEPGPGRALSLRLVSNDVVLLRLLSWSRSAVLASATPVDWSYALAGTRADPGGTLYEAVSKNAYISLVSLDPSTEGTRYYSDYTEYRAEGSFPAYPEGVREAVAGFVSSGADVLLDEVAKPLEARRMVLIRVSPPAATDERYSQLIRVVRSPDLGPVAGAGSDLSLGGPLARYYAKVALLRSRGRSVLVLAQNKEVARALASAFKARPCLGASCGVPEDRASHYQADGVIITWYRSRASRGVDIPADVDAVVAFPPYPRPSSFVNFRDDPTAFRLASMLSIPYLVPPLNGGGRVRAERTLLPIDLANGVAELAQAVGRAARSAMRTGRPVELYMPWMLITRVLQLAPGWLRLALVPS